MHAASGPSTLSTTSNVDRYTTRKPLIMRGPDSERVTETAMTELGCIYVAFGRPYLIQALHSVRTLRAASPSIPVCILTNVVRDPPPQFRTWDASTDVWLYVDAPDKDNRLYKTDLPRYTPFQKTLYLDSDTEILSDITGMFRFLDYWDVALHLKAEGQSRKKLKGKQVVLDGKESVAEIPHWNGGVVAFKAGPKSEEFFSLWNHYYQTGGIQYDQVALVEAAFRSSCRLLSLDGRWNAGPDWGHDRPDQTRYILHYLFFIDDRLAKDLLALEREIFGAGGSLESPEKSEVAKYLLRRESRREQEGKALSPWSRKNVIGVWKQLKRRAKASLPR
jgi:hypothetical protein